MGHVSSYASDWDFYGFDDLSPEERQEFEDIQEQLDIDRYELDEMYA